MSKSIKGIARNNLGYTGTVRLSQYSGKKKHIIAEMHNEGGRALFNFLIDCLTGDFDVARIDKPSKILLLYDDGSGVKEKVENTGFISMLTKPEKVYSEYNEGIIRYSFIIPQEYFAGTRFNAIGLYPKSASEDDVDNYAACCRVDTSEWNLSISSILVLDWELHISN